jgi:hypothetical protein
MVDPANNLDQLAEAKDKVLRRLVGNGWRRATVYVYAALYANSAPNEQRSCSPSADETHYGV